MDELVTERLIIRDFRPDDWSDLYEYLSDPKVVLYEPYQVFTAEQCKQAAIDRSTRQCFRAVCLKSTNKLIGNLYFNQIDPPIFLTWELGYVFNSEYQGNGYALESCRAVLRQGFLDLAIRRVIALCNTLNIPSWRLLERLGFRREGHYLKQSFFKYDEKGRPVWQDVYEYAILSDEWLSRNRDR